MAVETEDKHLEEKFEKKNTYYMLKSLYQASVKQNDAIVSDSN